MSTFQPPYTADEKAKMDSILDVFKAYIEEHYYFDVLYSKKCGYLYIVINGDDIPAEQLEDSSELLYRLFMDISSDVRALQMKGPHMTADLYPEEIVETRRRILPYFDSLTSDLKDYCVAEMNKFLDSRGK